MRKKTKPVSDEQAPDLGLKTGAFMARHPGGYHKVVYSVWGLGRDGGPSRPPLICVPGFERNRHDFDPLARALSHALTVWCPDMPGRGDSPPLANPDHYGFDVYMNDMDMLIGQTRAASVDWLGTSMGGLLGIQMASLPGSPIQRLVLNDVGPFVTAGLSAAALACLRQPPVFADQEVAESYIRKVYKGYGDLTAAQWGSMTQHSLRPTADGKWTLAFDPGIARSLEKLTQDVDMWKEFEKLTCEILIVRGSESTVLTAAMAQEMVRRGPAGKVQVVTIPRTAHAPGLTDAAQIDTIKTFLGVAHVAPAAVTREELTFLTKPNRNETCPKPRKKVRARAPA